MNALKNLNDMSDGERREAVLGFAQKVDDSVGEKFRIVKGWLLKVVAGIALLVGIIVILAGARNAGLGICGGGILFLGLGLRGISTRLRSVLVGVGIILVGCAFISYGLGQMSKAKQSVNWPSAPGNIIRSEKEKHTTTEKSGSSKREVTYYLAAIDYEYQVGGKSYRSNRIAYEGQNRNQTVALLNRYPKGKSVEVFYDPDDPEEAVLERGMKKGSYFMPIFGAVWGLFGLLIAFKGKKRELNTCFFL